MQSQRGNSSVGRARPCQGRGREFESRFPLQNKEPQLHAEVFCFAVETRTSGPEDPIGVDDAVGGGVDSVRACPRQRARVSFSAPRVSQSLTLFFVHIRSQSTSNERPRRPHRGRRRSRRGVDSVRACPRQRARVSFSAPRVSKSLTLFFVHIRSQSTSNERPRRPHRGRRRSRRGVDSVRACPRQRARVS